MDEVKRGDVTLEDLVALLTVEELANLCVGTERLEDDANAVGCASDRVIGAAGETWSALEETRKIPALILADGPAGLRLQPHFNTTAEGVKISGGELFG
ncbi:beta-glucosidase, partial [Lacrimispora saccharolytica]|nr:beta-glucosidase [Lacrimispora saccharolytica]